MAVLTLYLAAESGRGGGDGEHPEELLPGELTMHSQLLCLDQRLQRLNGLRDAKELGLL